MSGKMAIEAANHQIHDRKKKYTKCCFSVFGLHCRKIVLLFNGEICIDLRISFEFDMVLLSNRQCEFLSIFAKIRGYALFGNVAKKW